MRDLRSRTAATHPFTLAVGALLVLALTLVAAPAQAHDELISTNPADQAQVATMPDSVVLTFAEAAEPVGSQVIVRGPSGDVAQGKPVFAKTTVTQAVQPGAPAGAYTVLWRVTSDDGHPVSGRFTFTAAAAGADPTPSEAASPTSSTAAGASSPTGTASTSSTGATGSTAPRWLWLVVLLVLLVPVAIFVRRRPGGPRDASPGSEG